MVLVDHEDRVLLLYHTGPRDGQHWSPPGGGIEDGESPAEAAARELWEEVGFRGIGLQRPVWTWVHQFSYHGTLITQHETIYVTRTANRSSAGQAENLALDGIVDSRWWTLRELQDTAEVVWPEGLATLLPEALETTLDPPAPTRLG